MSININKKVFISYSHDSEEHKKWVLELAEFIRGDEIEVVCDQCDLALGADIPTFMEEGITENDFILCVCTETYTNKANSGIGGVGYEKHMATSRIFQNPSHRNRFIPIVRNNNLQKKLPSFFGEARYADLSGDKDVLKERQEIVNTILGHKPEKKSSRVQEVKEEVIEPVIPDPMIEFSNRFSQAFPGVRGVTWFEEQSTIVERLNILLNEPLTFGNGTPLVWWWRGPQNLEIQQFNHVENNYFLMDGNELHIDKIAALNLGAYYQKAVYVEVKSSSPTGVYPTDSIYQSKRLQLMGYLDEEYGLVDGEILVKREEYDDGAAIINGKLTDIRGRAEVRIRYITPYNFIIAPNQSPINSSRFDTELEQYLNQMLKGQDVFDEMCNAIRKLPKRENF
jgi:hypothetical protein